MNLMDLMIKVGVDDQATDGLSGIAGRVTSLADNIGNVLSTAAKVGTAAVGAASAAVGALTKSAVDNYADYEQLVGGAQLMFGDAYDLIAEKAAGAFATVQMSQNEYLQQANGFATGLKTALGGNEQAAAELAARIIQAEADIVAATGVAQESVQNAFNGIMKSNFSMLDNLQIGITPTKEGFQELIDKVNQWNEANGNATAYQMGNLADMQNALVDYIDMVGMSNYAQNEALATISGSMAAAKSAWQNFLTGLADENADMSGLTDNLVTSVAVAADNLLPRIQQAVSGIVNAFGELTGIDLSGFVTAVSGFVGQAVATVQELGAAFTDGGVTAAVDLLVSKFGELTGIDLSGAAASVSSLATAFGEFALGKIEGIASAISTVFAPFKENAGPIIESVSGAVSAFLGSLSSFDAAGGLQTIADGVSRLFAPFVSNLAPIIDGISGAVSGFFGFLSGLASGPVATLADAVVRLLSPFVGGLVDTIQAIATALSGIFQYANDNLNGPLQTLADLVGRLFGVFTPKLREFISNIVTALTEFVTLIAKRVIDNVGKFADMLEKVYQFLEPIIVYIWDAITAIAEFVAALVTSRGNISSIMYAIGKLFGDAANSVIDLWGSVIDFFKGLPDKLLGFFSGIGSRFSSIGTEIVNGIKSGLTAAWDGLKSFVSGLWDGLTGASEEANEIHSPSRVYYRIARQMVEGAVVGWRENFGLLQDAVESDFASLAAAGGTVIPTSRVDFADSAIGKSSAAAMNTILAASYSENKEIRIPLYLNGREIAQATYRDLEQITRQRGE